MAAPRILSCRPLTFLVRSSSLRDRFLSPSRGPTNSCVRSVRFSSRFRSAQFCSCFRPARFCFCFRPTRFYFCFRPARFRSCFRPARFSFRLRPVRSCWRPARFCVREEPFNANLLTVQCRCVLSPSPPQAGSSVLRATRLCQSEDSPVTAAANAPGAKEDTAGSTRPCRRSFSRKIRLGHLPATPAAKRLTTKSSHYIQPLFCLT